MVMWTLGKSVISPAQRDPLSLTGTGDLGAQNGKPGSSCTKDCRKCGVCGDGHLDAGEECKLLSWPIPLGIHLGMRTRDRDADMCCKGDLGKDNGKPGASCTVDCKKCGYCGDGHQDAGEECK